MGIITMTESDQSIRRKRNLIHNFSHLPFHGKLLAHSIRFSSSFLADAMKNQTLSIIQNQVKYNVKFRSIRLIFEMDLLYQT